MGRRRYNTDIDLQGNRLYNVGTLVPTPMASPLIDFADTVDNVQTLSVALGMTFTTANLAAGRSKIILITSSVVSTLNFPAAWKWYGASKLTATLLSKEIKLVLTCYGTTDADVRAEWAAQI